MGETGRRGLADFGEDESGSFDPGDFAARLEGEKLRSTSCGGEDDAEADFRKAREIGE
jgi:hypothetical protein